MPVKVWKILGYVLQWMGVIYFVGYALFGLVAVVLLIPKYQHTFQAAGQGAIFGSSQIIIGPLILFFLLVSAGSWYHGRDLVSSPDNNWLDYAVGVALLLAMLILATPQLYTAYFSLIPALRG